MGDKSPYQNTVRDGRANYSKKGNGDPERRLFLNSTSTYTSAGTGDQDPEVFIHGSSIPKDSRRRGWTTKLGLILLLVIIVLLVAIFIFLAVKERNSEDMCLSPHCVETASQMLYSMDQTVSPCEDFYMYACGSWLKKHIIPDDRPSFNTFSKLLDEINVKLKGLLENDFHADDAKAIHQAKDLYKSCLNTSVIEDRGLDPLHTLIKEMGGWPILEDGVWQEESFDWVETMSKLRLYNNRILINQWVSSDDRKSSLNIIQFDQPQLGMPSREYFLKGWDHPPLQAYMKFAKTIAMIVGASEETADRDTKDMVEFEIALANATMPEEERRDHEKLYNKMQIQDLYRNVTSNIDWMKYLGALFHDTGIPINQSTQVVLYSVKYMQHLGELVKTTPKRAVANYLIWGIIMNRVRSLPRQLLDARQEYMRVLSGIDMEQARWKICMSFVKENFGMAIGQMFVSHHFHEDARKTALIMIDDLQEAFSGLLDHAGWMDDTTKEKAREKAKYIEEQIGYPDYIMDDNILNQMYEGVDISPETFFENILSSLRRSTFNSFLELNRTVSKERWSKAPSVVNAFYSAPKNQIIFPAAILQPPFYNKHYPKSMNYGAIGMVIGHEITHGFDDRGRQFDKDGNLQQWWSDPVIAKFKERAQCIVDQYSNYTVPEISMNVNGKQTQGENIADNGGLKQAYWAYQKWVERNGPELRLPGINLTHNQIFFLSFAQVWCGLARPETYTRAIHTGNHSPGMFRVKGPISNFAEFSKAYNCPLGSKMNPVKKCAVW